MKKLTLLCLLALTYSSKALCFDYPKVTITFPTKPPSTVYEGDTLRFPVTITYKNLRTYKFWYFPAGTGLEVVNDQCPDFFGDEKTYVSGTCIMNIYIPANQVGKIITGNLTLNVSGKEGEHSWNYSFLSPRFTVKVIPQPAI